MKANEIHRIVEYIRTAGIGFDAADLEEDVREVLGQYGFIDGLADEDVQILKGELLPMGLAVELAEVARSVSEEPSGMGLVTAGELTGL